MGVWRGVTVDSLSIARACHGLPFYALQVAIPETALWLFQGWLSKEWVACGSLLPPWTPLVIHFWHRDKAAHVVRDHHPHCPHHHHHHHPHLYLHQVLLFPGLSSHILDALLLLANQSHNVNHILKLCSLFYIQISFPTKTVLDK
jgi:hypothetical protein